MATKLNEEREKTVTQAKTRSNVYLNVMFIVIGFGFKNQGHSQCSVATVANIAVIAIVTIEGERIEYKKAIS